MLDSQIIKDPVAYNSYLLDKKRQFTAQDSNSNKLSFKNLYQLWKSPQGAHIVECLPYKIYNSHIEHH